MKTTKPRKPRRISRGAAKKGPALVHLALLDSYAVRWDAATVARDVVQNFFDEVEDFAEVSISLDRKAHTIRVEGPGAFAVEYLRYIGATTKGVPERRTAGGFGEASRSARWCCFGTLAP